MRYVVTVKSHTILNIATNTFMGDYSSLDAAFYQVYKIQRNYRVMGCDLEFIVYDKKEEREITKDEYESQRNKTHETPA